MRIFVVMGVVFWYLLFELMPLGYMLSAEEVKDDFEQGDKSPLGWSTYSSPGTKAVFKWDNQTAHSGEYSLYLKNQGPVTALWQKAIPVIGNVEYQLKVWAKVKNGIGKTSIAVRCKNRTGEWIRGGSFNSSDEDMFLKGTTDWEQLVFRVRVPDNACEACIFLINRYPAADGNGDEVWFDDLEVENTIIENFTDISSSIINTLRTDWEILKQDKNVDPNFASEVNEWLRKLKLARKKVKKQVAFTIKEQREIWKLLTACIPIQRKIQRDTFFFKLQKKREPLGSVWVDSMERVFIDDLPITSSFFKNGQMDVFPGEREAIQLVLVPFRDMQNLSLTVNALPGPKGNFPADKLSWKVVGYVKIDKPGRNYYQEEPFPYHGWWPDPLLEKDFFQVEKKTLQPVWIEVKVPKKQLPGVYPLQIEIKGEDLSGKKVFHTAKLNIEILPGKLPDKWYMKKMLSFAMRIAREGNVWSGQRVYYGKRWDDVAQKYYDLLIDYRIGIGSLYESIDSHPPNVIEEAVKRGQNFIFAANINRALQDKQGNITLVPSDISKIEKIKFSLAPWLIEKGLLSISYFYGFDEQWPQFFGLCREIFSDIKKTTGLKTITTIRDRSYGTNSILSNAVDVYVDPVNAYNRTLARKARSQGREVWWYSAYDFNIETNPVYHRSIPWNTIAVEADGYLIWCMNRWKDNNRFISKDIRSEWNSYLDGVGCSSSGMFIYPGQDGPVSSIRLENFRDGVEDYDLLADTALRLKKDKESFYEATRRLLKKLGLSSELSSLTPVEIRQMRKKLSFIIRDINNGYKDKVNQWEEKEEVKKNKN